MIGDEISPIKMEKAEINMSTVLQKVFALMTVGLVVTGITSLVVISNLALLEFLLNTFYIWLIAELIVVIFLSAKIEKIGSGTGMIAFILYAIINGMTLSTIFLAYTYSSIASTFFITAGMFAGAALFGKLTKKDLSSLSGFLSMALIGLIIAGIVEIFIYNDMLSFIISAVGIVIFVALTAYDVQKIKSYAEQIETGGQEGIQKLVIMGALSLYLDFINIFLKLLRIFGRSRD